MMMTMMTTSVKSLLEMVRASGRGPPTPDTLGLPTPVKYYFLDIFSVISFSDTYVDSVIMIFNNIKL
jgi:hypothetical protein